MMMSSTSMTSQSGVTLMSDLTPPLAPPRSIAITLSPCIADCGLRIYCGFIAHSLSSQSTINPQSAILNVLSGLLDEVVNQLRRGVVHLHVEVLDAAREVV